MLVRHRPSVLSSKDQEFCNLHRYYLEMRANPGHTDCIFFNNHSPVNYWFLLCLKWETIQASLACRPVTWFLGFCLWMLSGCVMGSLLHSVKPLGAPAHHHTYTMLSINYYEDVERTMWLQDWGKYVCVPDYSLGLNITMIWCVVLVIQCAFYFSVRVKPVPSRAW